MTNEEERRRRFEEALQRARQQGALSPEHLQMVEQAFQQMQQSGATRFTYTGTQLPDGTVAQQGGQPAGYPSGTPAMKAPPTTILPGQQPNPSALPQGYVDPLYQNAVADLQRWLGQYEKYRMQGHFAQLEPIFQTIKHVTGR